MPNHTSDRHPWFTWSEDTTARLGAADGAPGPVLQGHTEQVSGALQLKDGRLFTWSFDKTARLWPLEKSLLTWADAYIERLYPLSPLEACSYYLEPDETCAPLNGFSDSSLSVIGTLRTRLFIGCDIWAEVGAGAEMEYGVGYCLPIGYRDAEGEAIMPRHDEDETAKIVVAEPNPEGYLLNVEQFVDRVRSGQPIFG